MDTDLTQTIELVRRAKDGERASLDRLCARYYPRVLRIVRARIHSDFRQVLASEDVAQAVFIKALRQFDRFEFRNDASLVNWLARIAQWEIHDHRSYYLAQQRDVRRQQRIQSNPGSCTQPAPIDPSTRPLDRAIRQERQSHVTEAVASLPEVERELIVLLWLHVAGGSG